jgi:hypothetical protein
MNLYDIGFLVFCMVITCLILFGVTKNVLTEYGVGLLIGVLVFGIIGYNSWTDIQNLKIIKSIDPPSLEIEIEKCSDLVKQIKVLP